MFLSDVKIKILLSKNYYHMYNVNQNESFNCQEIELKLQKTVIRIKENTLLNPIQMFNKSFTT